MEKGLEFVVREMCKRVGADFDSIDFKEPEWYNKYSWTMEEEAEFRRWLVDQLLRKKEVREGLLANPNIRLTKKIAEKAAQEFVLRFGWRYVRTDENTKEYY